MDDKNKKLSKDFEKPIALPISESQSKRWQEANKLWWENNPMRYDWKDIIVEKEFSAEFYKEIDKRFFDNAVEYLNKSFSLPFGEFIDFESLKNKDVLEIGVGNGSHAQLLASSAKSFIGVDITDYAVESAKKRFEVFNLLGQIIKMDAESLEFKDSSFDFVWSWGVIHHSSDTMKIIREIHRVLRSNGKAVVMVYYRGWWDYYFSGFLRSFFSGDLFRGLTLSDSVQKYTDGAIARYYNQSDWGKITEGLFKIIKVETTGPKSDIILLPGGIFKELFKKIMPSCLNRFLVKNLKMGSFLVLEFSKI